MVATPEEYIASLDEPRRSDVAWLDDLIHNVLCSVDGEYLAERYAGRLGKQVSVGKSCVRFKRGSDIDHEVLRELLVETGRLGPPNAA